MAQDLLNFAHAPYSNFQVAAIVQDDKNQIHSGVNVENAAYPLGTCAEAGAIAAMIAKGGTSISQIIILGASDEICTPCGGCRQRIAEFANQESMIICTNRHGHPIKTYRIHDLLPDRFKLDE